MATITSLGSGSGLDLEGIVTKLMAVEQQPLTTLSNRQSGLQSMLSAFGAIQGSLSALQTSAKNLATTSTFTSFSTSVSDTSVMTASASTGATAGVFTVSVGQLAQAQVLRGNSSYAATTASFNTGSLAISVGSASATSITIDGSNNTLSGIRDAINAANAGVTASIINDGTTNRLLFSSNSTGLTAGAISVTATDSGSGGSNALSDLDGASLIQTRAPLDARFSVNGLDISRPTNTITDVIDKVSFSLNKAGTLAVPITTQLTVARDNASTQTAINGFITTYNTFVKLNKSLSSYDATNNKASILTGDGTLRSIRTQLSALVGSNVTGLAGNVGRLSDIGIATNSDGTLTADATKLQAALSDPNKNVAGLFNSTASGNQGIAVRFNSTLQNIVGATGLISSRTDGINQSIKRLGTQQDALSLRLTRIEAAYRAQFAALDSSISSMQSTSTYLTQQLSYLQSLATGVSSTSSK